MNGLSYDPVVLGNYYFDLPPKVLLKSLQHSRFTWLAVNLTFNDQTVLPPYVVLGK
jgi:2',3'-cyclic-nucleotide 2'-phosphodiesterase (5'-nucleotidase family)